MLDGFPVETDWVDFIGTYSPAPIYEEGDAKHNLYLGSGNTLYYPTSTDFAVGAFRAYFQLRNGLTAGEPTSPQQAPVRAFTLNFGDASAIISMSKESRSEGEGWFTIDGRKLGQRPTAPGLYINNGRKVVIK